MRFVCQKTTEQFKVREGNGEVVIDDLNNVYGLMVDNVFFCFLNKHQAEEIAKMVDRPWFEKFFNSVDISDKSVEFKSKAQCRDDFESRFLDPRYVPEEEYYLYESTLREAVEAYARLKTEHILATSRL